jgi:hypothetical protein
LIWQDGAIALPVHSDAFEGEADWTIDPAAIRLLDARDDVPDAVPVSIEVQHVIGRTVQLGVRCGQGRLWVSMPVGQAIPESLAVQLPAEAIRWWKRHA